MLKIAIVIETADRRLFGKTNYLQTTVDNLKRAGVFQSSHFDSLTIVSGGEQPGFYDGDVRFIACGDRKISRQQNAANAIREGIATGAEYVLKLEDDLDFVDDFLDVVGQWLAQYGHAPACMFTLGWSCETVVDSHYSTEDETVYGPGQSFPRIREFMKQGIDKLLIHPASFWGAQAVMWKRCYAQNLAEWLGEDPWYLGIVEETCQPGEVRDHGHDLLLGQWAMTTDRPTILVPVPSFVQHIGRQSSLKNTFFQFPWPGRQWVLHA